MIMMIHELRAKILCWTFSKWSNYGLYHLLWIIFKFKIIKTLTLCPLHKIATTIDPQQTQIIIKCIVEFKNELTTKYLGIVCKLVNIFYLHLSQSQKFDLHHICIDRWLINVSQKRIIPNLLPRIYRNDNLAVLRIFRLLISIPFSYASQ